jgi:hypothetical protein
LTTTVHDRTKCIIKKKNLAKLMYDHIKFIASLRKYCGTLSILIDHLSTITANNNPLANDHTQSFKYQKVPTASEIIMEFN